MIFAAFTYIYRSWSLSLWLATNQKEETVGKLEEIRDFSFINPPKKME
jgi:hypothetical protein